MNFSQKYVLAVGLSQHRDCFEKLTVPVCCVETGSQAIRQLRCCTPSVLIGRWDLPDMPDGTLFQRVLNGFASVATVALVQLGNTTQEVAARSLGITVVLDDNVDKKALKELLDQLSTIEITAGT